MNNELNEWSVSAFIVVYATLLAYLGYSAHVNTPILNFIGVTHEQLKSDDRAESSGPGGNQLGGPRDRDALP